MNRGMGSLESVKEFLKASVADCEVREFDSSTKNSALAASVLGCTVGEIAKSIVFKGEGFFVVVLSGDRRVDASKLASAAGGSVRVASPEEVREGTGYPIGGVPPFPHRKGVTVFVDSSLMRFPHVWAAAGVPSAVFRISSADVVKLIGRSPCDLSS